MTWIVLQAPLNPNRPTCVCLAVIKYVVHISQVYILMYRSISCQPKIDAVMIRKSLNMHEFIAAVSEVW